MERKPTYEELEQRVKELGNEAAERKLVEEALRESEGKFRILSDQALMGIIILQEELFVYVNDRAAEIMEVTAEEIANWSLGDYAKLIHPDDLAFVMEQGRKKQTGEKDAVIQYNWRMVTPGGNLKWIEMWSKTIHFASRTADMVTMIDITERVRAEEALRESERALKVAQRVAKIGSWWYDPVTQMPTWTEEMFHIFGLEPKPVAVPYEEHRNIIHPEDWNLFDTAVTGAVTEGVGYDLELRITWPNGEIKYVNAKCEVKKDENGIVIELVGTTQDITDKKLAEKALQENEERFRVIATNTPDHILIQDKDLRYVWVLNPQLDLTEKDMIGKTDFDFLSREDAVNLSEIKKKVIETGNPEFVKVPLLSLDGDMEYFEGSYIPNHDQEGEIDGLIGYFRNVTERVKGEEALRESEELFRLLTTISPVGIYQTDENGKCIYVNGRWCEIAGISADEAAGDGWMKSLYPEDREQIGTLWQEMVEAKGRWGHEYRFQKPDGRITWVYGLATPIQDKKGSVVGYMGINVDVTERKKGEEEKKKLETQLFQSQKMEAVGTLSGGIAHDFNNILAIIMGNAELAYDDVPDWNPASKSLKEIRLASIRARDMVKQLLAFSRKSDERSKPLNMVTIIKESMKMLRSAVPTSVEFRQYILDDPCNILGDAAQINQIVMNMVTNSAHAMSKEGGHLEVTLGKFMLQEEKTCFDGVLSPGPYVRLRVKDTGEGIDPEIMARIFEPYFTTKDVGKGTGMGLSVVHGIVKRHGGGIQVESELGEGTVFEIYFPALEKAIKKEKKPDGEIKGGSERILFVDDEESIVNLNRQRLERLGYQVKSTIKPLEALDWFKADPDQFDVVITDMTMPRMTGDRLTKEILAIRPEMLIIICTGYSERISAKEVDALGARKYIEKPIDTRNLASALREIFDEK